MLSGWAAAYAAVAPDTGVRAERRLGERDLLRWTQISRRNRARNWRFQYRTALGLAVLLALMSIFA
jgi:hypothetical protein